MYSYKRAKCDLRKEQRAMRRSTLNFGFRDGFLKKVTFELGHEGRIEVSQIQGRTLRQSLGLRREAAGFGTQNKAVWLKVMWDMVPLRIKRK